MPRRNPARSPWAPPQILRSNPYDRGYTPDHVRPIDEYSPGLVKVPESTDVSAKVQKDASRAIKYVEGKIADGSADALAAARKRLVRRSGQLSASGAALLAAEPAKLAQYAAQLGLDSTPWAEAVPVVVPRTSLAFDVATPPEMVNLSGAALAAAQAKLASTRRAASRARKTAEADPAAQRQFADALRLATMAAAEAGEKDTTIQALEKKVQAARKRAQKLADAAKNADDAIRRAERAEKKAARLEEVVNKGRVPKRIAKALGIAGSLGELAAEAAKRYKGSKKAGAAEWARIMKAYGITQASLVMKVTEAARQAEPSVSLPTTKELRDYVKAQAEKAAEKEQRALEAARAEGALEGAIAQAELAAGERDNPGPMMRYMAGAGAGIAGFAVGGGGLGRVPGPQILREGLRVGTAAMAFFGPGPVGRVPDHLRRGFAAGVLAEMIIGRIDMLRDRIAGLPVIGPIFVGPDRLAVGSDAEPPSEGWFDLPTDGVYPIEGVHPIEPVSGVHPIPISGVHPIPISGVSLDKARQRRLHDNFLAGLGEAAASGKVTADAEGCKCDVAALPPPPGILPSGVTRRGSQYIMPRSMFPSLPFKVAGAQPTVEAKAAAAARPVPFPSGVSEPLFNAAC